MRQITDSPVVRKTLITSAAVLFAGLAAAFAYRIWGEIAFVVTDFGHHLSRSMSP